MLHPRSRPHLWVTLYMEAQACMALQQDMEVPMMVLWVLVAQEVT